MMCAAAALVAPAPSIPHVRRPVFRQLPVYRKVFGVSDGSAMKLATASFAATRALRVLTVVSMSKSASEMVRGSLPSVKWAALAFEVSVQRKRSD
jgi:hypothetical protein